MKKAAKIVSVLLVVFLLGVFSTQKIFAGEEGSKGFIEWIYGVIQYFIGEHDQNPDAHEGILHYIHSNVMDFGAIPGDDINDHDAFVAAIEDAGEGGTIFVPMPEARSDAYLVDHIGLLSGQTLLGPGRGSVIIRAFTPRNGSGVRHRDDQSFVLEIRVSGLSFENFQYGIDARGVYESHFEDIELVGNTVNVILGNIQGQEAGSIWDVFDRIKMAAARERDLMVDCYDAGPVHLNTFNNCQFETTGNPPLFRGCGGNGLAGNSFRGSEFRNGISIGNVSSITFHSNYFEGGIRQIELGGLRGASIAGNYFNDWGEAGIWITSNGVVGVEISGNSFYGRPIERPPAIKVVEEGEVTCGNIHVLGNAYTDANPLEDVVDCVTQL